MVDDISRVKYENREDIVSTWKCESHIVQSAVAPSRPTHLTDMKKSCHWLVFHILTCKTFSNECQELGLYSDIVRQSIGFTAPQSTGSYFGPSLVRFRCIWDPNQNDLHSASKIWDLKKILRRTISFKDKRAFVYEVHFELAWKQKNSTNTFTCLWLTDMRICTQWMNKHCSWSQVELQLHCGN